MKICSKCKEEKELVEFNKRFDRKSGYKSECKKCTSIRKSNKYLNDKDISPVSLWVNQNFNNVKYRAGKNNILFTLDKDHISNLLEKQRYKCIFCDKDLNFKGTSSNRMSSPTIDRIIPIEGYTNNNITISCYRCNAIKNDATYEELMIISNNLKKLVESIKK